VICYADSTLALPLITAYALAKHPPRERKRLYDRRRQMLEALRQAFLSRGRVAEADAGKP